MSKKVQFAVGGSIVLFLLVVLFLGYVNSQKDQTALVGGGNAQEAFKQPPAPRETHAASVPSGTYESDTTNAMAARVKYAEEYGYNLTNASVGGTFARDGSVVRLSAIGEEKRTLDMDGQTA